jgi:co-chaperonin GroES (HSP10)
MILKGDQLPGMPAHDLIMIQPDPVETETIVKLVIPELAQVRASSGRIVHAGLKARDQMYDNGHELGDRIWFGKYAGIWEEWDHITEPGKEDCTHDWARAPNPGDRMQAFVCECGAKRLQEPVLVMNVADIKVNVSLEDRLRSGDMGIFYATTEDGRTQHVIRRRSSTISTLKESHAA